MKAELYIAAPGGAKLYLPAVEEGIEWTTQRRSTPGKLTFHVLRDDKLQLEEGAAVQLRVDGKPVFFGFIFTQKRDKDERISVTAYDQLRYLNNKDTYVYENKTASDLLRMIAADFSLQTGNIEDTGFVIASRVEDNTSLFDMIENALDLTLQNNGGMYILYDDFGKLALKNISTMIVGEPSAYFMIDETTGENFEYSSSIDKDVYNKVKLIYENEDSGAREVYIAQDGSHIGQWGVLQYFDTLQKGENGQAKAEALLKLYNAKTRTLKITGALGDVRVRAGSMIVVNLNLGDIHVKNLMLCEQVRHTFKLDEHRMDVTLRGAASLPDASELLKVIKQTAVKAVDSQKPAAVCFGKVTSISPLQILVEQKLLLKEEQLVLCRDVTEYKTEITGDNVKDFYYLDKLPDPPETSEPPKLPVAPPHVHAVGKIELTVHNGLAVGEEVVLLRMQGGQKFVVVDRLA